MGSASPGRGREMSSEPNGNGICPSPNSVRTELDRILASASFRGSPPLRRFLSYTVEHSLHGEADQLKEYRLGLEVFGRRSSYEPQKDRIVRLEARRLRAKLREYYEDEGRQDPVRISVPKGGYAATFSANGHSEPPFSLPVPPLTPPTEPRPPLSRKAKIGMTAVICSVALLMVGWAFSRRQGHLSTSSQAVSMAVLPFRNLSGDPGQDYLADGITENLINNLSRVPGLRLMAPSTVIRYKGRDSDPRKVGKDLHVSAVLTGKLLEQDETLVVQIELIDVTKGSLLWDNQYSGKLTDIQSIQEDISRDIPGQLRLHLTDEEMARLVKPRTESSEAFSCICGGATTGTNKPRRDSPRRSSTLTWRSTIFSVCIGLRGAAECDVLLAEYTVLPSKEALPKAREAAGKALELDETLAEAHTSLGAVRADYEWDSRGAENGFGEPSNSIRATRQPISGMPNDCPKRVGTTKPLPRSDVLRSSTRCRSLSTPSQEGSSFRR